MKVVQLNAVCGYGSTGKIAVSISKLLNSKNIENYIFYVGKKSDYEYGINIANNKYLKLQALKARFFGNYGFNSKFITRKMINKIKEIKPDIIHLHNVHGHNVNLDYLFKYLKKTDIKIVWTFHDCWGFTGYCMHFDYQKCFKWQSKCHNCPQKKSYSWLFDRSAWIYNKKKNLYSALENLTVITPSEWLGDLVGKSFLKNRRIKVINNGIDLDVFKPTPSNFREKYSLQDKVVILGVLMGIDQKKGIDYFFELSKILDDNKKIVIVGMDDQSISKLPPGIIGINRTNNQQELAEIYTAADVFLNCTLEDTFPTVNIEALACGTPVVTFKTGGSPEIVDENVGAVVEQGNIKEALKQIDAVLKKENVSEKCRAKAVGTYDASKKFNEYIDLYFEVLK